MTEEERPSPTRFPLDDRRVYDAYIAGRKSAAIAAGVRAGLFELLSGPEGPVPLDGVRTAMGWSERGTRSMLAALVALGFVEESASGFAASDDARAYLTRDRPGSLWGLVDMEVDSFLSPRALLDALERDDASVYGGDDPWEAHGADPDRARVFTAAMHSVSERPAAGVAERIDLSNARRLLDVGGGSAALSIALAEANPALECVVWDIPAVCPLAAEYVARAGLSARVSAQPGDMFEEPYPDGFDAVLLSQILHDWGHAKGETLVRKAFDALPVGGRLLVHEKLVEDGAAGPLANVLVHLDMLVWTEGQQYGVAELIGLLERCGFEDVRRTRTAGYWSVVDGRKT
ncbi:MAG: methyltransferase [Planctomycetota bacterium]